MSPRRRVTPVPALLAAALLFAGCATEDDEPAGTAGSPASATASSSGGPAGGSSDGGSADDGTSDGGSSGGGSSDGGDGSGDAPPFPADVRPDLQDPSAGAQVTVTDIRTARHEGFDRVVFEVDGEGLPGWDVRYVDDPTSQGSGDPVEVAGDAVLQVTVSGVGYPSDTGVEQFSPGGPVPGSGTEVVTEVVLGATFEGTTEAFIGTAARAPFRVYLLEGPARVVVEVAG